jgi:hypothetical protein
MMNFRTITKVGSGFLVFYSHFLVTANQKYKQGTANARLKIKNFSPKNTKKNPEDCTNSNAYPHLDPHHVPDGLNFTNNEPPVKVFCS